MKSPRRRSVLGLLGVSAAVAIALPIYTIAFGAGPQAPDLRADPVEHVTGPEFYSTASGLGQGRLLVRFDGFVTNVGQGPLEVSGNPQVSGSAGMHQWARTAAGQDPRDGQIVGTPTVTFETADGHNHFHLRAAMKYSLWNSTETAEVAPGQKVGFCLYDLQAVAGALVNDPQTYVESVTHFCDQWDPTATSLRMGTSPGWRDVYNKGLSYQWVDVSNTAPGVYYVASEADPDNTLWEGGGSAETNPRAFANSTPVTIPGWIAQPPVAKTQTGATQTITFATQKFGGQGDSTRRFRIVTPPTHGSLSVPTGSLFTPSSVTYTPAAGYTGADSFTYAAINSGYVTAALPNGYPLNPITATVSLTSTAPTVAISGAPGSMIAGTSVQLSSALANLGGGVTWSTTGGTITPSGLFTAPAAPGSATVTATSTANPAVKASVTIGIAPVPPQTALPSVTGVKPVGKALLSTVATGHIGKRIIVGKVITGPKNGTVTFTATINRTVLGRCSAKVPARHSFTCKIVLKRNYPLTKVLMTAQMKIGKTSIVKRSYVVKRTR